MDTAGCGPQMDHIFGKQSTYFVYVWGVLKHCSRMQGSFHRQPPEHYMSPVPPSPCVPALPGH